MRWPQWVVERLETVRAERARPGQCPLIALSGPPGAGKSTLAAQWAGQVPGLAVVGLDDFYLSGPERSALAGRTHPWFARRGAPGTHDLDALCRTLDQLDRGRACTWPAWDKGRDRAVAGGRCWPGGRPAAVVLEGWCLGCRPLTAQPVPAAWRRQVNGFIETYRTRLFRRFDALIFLRAPDRATVAAWRQEAERNRPPGQARFTPDQVRALLEPMLPIVQDMLVNPPEAAAILELDHRRNPRPDV